MASPHGNLVEAKEVPREDKSYLGDGLYAIYDGRLSIYLQAYNGVEVLQSVALDDVCLSNLVRFAKEKGFDL